MTQKTKQLGRSTAQRPRLQQPDRRANASTADAVQRAPKLRRTFSPLEPGRESILRERNQAAFSNEPRRADLERRLLDLGGTFALLFLPDHQIGELLDRGRYFPGVKALFSQGEDSACHANASMLFVASRGEVRIASGYALSPDGLWRQHSWGVVVEDGRVVETTERRVRYFGFVLNDSATLLCLLGTIKSGDLWPKEVKQVRRFIAKFYRLPAETEDRIDRLLTEGMSSR
jgi:hypothetical protein